jgi:hypothetical protein
MGCYIVPLLAAGVHYLMRRKNGWNDKYNKILNLLFVGGAIFGVVDHAWNKELFAFSLHDLILGVMITISIVLVGLGFILVDKIRVAQEIKG